MPSRSRGFTLVETLIVIVVIAILAAISLPRLLGAARQARDAALRDTLHELRNSISLYQASLGCYPAQLSDLVRGRSDPPAHGISADGSGTIAITHADWEGPYFESPRGVLPDDPITGHPDWSYSTSGATVGQVHSVAAAAGMDGKPYSGY